jgi:predicted  nucleic acid-binding Zn-ribbon protein
MARDNDPPKTLKEMIDELERIREELLALQRSMEKMESVNPDGTVKKKPK